jgi:hypothetical protein
MVPLDNLGRNRGLQIAVDNGALGGSSALS